MSGDSSTHIIKQILSLGARIKTHKVGTMAELEARFGMFLGGRYLPKVPQSFFEATLEHIQSQTMSGGKHETMDVFYGHQHRCTVEHNSDDFCILPTHWCKTRVAHMILHNEHYGIGIKISLNKERLLKSSNVPMLVKTTHCRIKERYSYCFSNWRVDFTKVWSGRTVSKAEHSCLHDKPTHEIEIELIDPKHLKSENPDDLVEQLYHMIYSFIPPHITLKTDEISLFNVELK
tara:strand:- start:9727 stop:10425 length:699 start_codon:yes stop_codon:yes gene_type:complete